jgi:serine/threonine protein phosphatase 1
VIFPPSLDEPRGATAGFVFFSHRHRQTHRRARFSEARPQQRRRRVPQFVIYRYHACIHGDNSRILAIGDIHGCARALDALLRAVAPTADDLIITLGDYVDRGPDSARVIERLIRFSTTHQLIPLRGNHEEMMMEARDSSEALEFWESCGGRTALDSYADGGSGEALSLASVPDAHWAFLDDQCRDYYQTNDHFFVHGGVDATLPLDKQAPFILHWEKYPPPRPHISGKTMICGHTPQAGSIPGSLPHAICLDTGAGFGGWLTCLEVATGQVWQSNQRGEIRETVLKAPRRRW